MTEKIRFTRVKILLCILNIIGIIVTKKIPIIITNVKSLKKKNYALYRLYKF